MTPEGIPIAPIPVEWTKTVSKILREGDRNKIHTRMQSDRDWEAAFPAAWDLDRFDALAAALAADEVMGLRVTTMREPGEVYAFWFHFENRKLYGKINLLPSKDQILIYSSHVPRKGENL